MPLPESLNQLRAINFSDLAIKQIGAWPLLLRISLWLLIFVAILLCGEVFVISDLRRQFHIAAENESKLLRLYSAKAFQTANLDAYRQQLIDLKSMFTASVKQLPDTADMPNLLEDINNTAISSGLRMQAISLQPEKVAEFTFELPMRIEVTGDYHAFGSFVSGITSLTRVVTLHDYSIETYNESSLKMVIEAKAYRYRESAN
ncbi:MAG: type 4a pilus biogenesis protein PilO [Porticoccaceae bacterium]